MWWRQKDREEDLERELRSDLELEAAEQREKGLSPEEASYAAQRAFGSVTLIKEDTRAMCRWTLAEQFAHDLRYALRQLRKSPGFTLTAVLSLALELQTAAQPTIFVNNLQAPMYFAQLVVRTTGDPGRMTRAVEAAIHRVDPDQPVTYVETMDQAFSDSVAQLRFELVLMMAFGGIAGLLAVIGIYAVVAYSVAQRTREIGIRVALGAQRADVRRMVLLEGAVLAASGISIGLMGALALTRMLRTLLFETAPSDPATLASVAVTILFVVLLATLIPTQRAAQVSPNTALRYE